MIEEQSVHHQGVPPRFRSHAAAVFVFLAGIFAAVVFFWHLGTAAASDTDESTHAMVTREMRLSGDFTTMHLLGKEYFRKPPLAFWLRVGSEVVFGENEFALRFFSAVAGVGTTFLLMWWGWLLTRRRAMVVIIGLIFPLLPITQIHTFRHGDTDGILIFLLTLSAYFLWKSFRYSRYLIAASIVLAFATLTKSAGMIVVPATFGLTLLVLRRWPYAWRHVVFAGIAFVAIAAPWHIAETVRHGGVFWGDYLGYHIIERTTSSIVESSMNRGTLWYLKAGEKGMYPWSWLLIPATFLALRSFRKKEERATETFLLFWGFGTVVLYSLARTKLDWYIAPAYPAFMLLIARFLSTPFETVPRWLRGVTIVTIGAFFLRSIYLYYIGTKAAFPFTSLSFSRSVVLTCAVIGVATVATLFLARRWHISPWRYLLVPALLSLVIISVRTWDKYERSKRESSFRVFRTIIEMRAPKKTIYFYDIGYIQKPEAHWYLRGADNEREVVALREVEADLITTIQNDVGSFVIAERERVFSQPISARLELLESATTLALYQITSDDQKTTINE